MTRSATLRMGSLTAALVLFTGCTSGSEPVYTELDRPQVDSDIFPEANSEILDTESTRLVGEFEGRSFYLALPAHDEIEDGICILVAGVDVPDGAVSTCTGPNSVTGYPFGDLRHDPSRIPDSAVQDGWLRISDNLIFKPK